MFTARPPCLQPVERLPGVNIFVVANIVRWKAGNNTGYYVVFWEAPTGIKQVGSRRYGQIPILNSFLHIEASLIILFFYKAPGLTKASTS